MDNTIEFVEVFAGELWQAAVVKDLLEDNGIGAFVENELMGNIAPWQVSAGGVSSVTVKISSSDYAVAKELVDSFTHGDSSLLEGEEDS